MSEWGINHYQPRWCKSVGELSNLLSQTSLVGMQIQSIWSLWDEESQWWREAPIVICTQQHQLEFCAGANDFSFSLDSIDLNLSVYLYAGAEDIDAVPCHWFQGRNIEIEDLAGKFITGTEVIVSHGNGYPEPVGIAIEMADERLEIINGCADNLLSRSKNPYEGLNYIPVES